MVLLLSATAHASPADETLGEAELRLGYGIAVGGGEGGMTTKRPTPLTITALGAIATSDEPHTSAFGGFVIETLDRSSVGVTAGVRLQPTRAIRLAAGGTWMFAPYTLWGATGSVGACARGKAKLGLCGDVQLTTYFAGTDLTDGRATTQIQAVVGMTFDAF